MEDSTRHAVPWRPLEIHQDHRYHVPLVQNLFDGYSQPEDFLFFVDGWEWREMLTKDRVDGKSKLNFS